MRLALKTCTLDLPYEEMLDFCAEHGLGSWIETIGVDEVDEAYDRVVAGDVQFRFVIDTETFAPAAG